MNTHPWTMDNDNNKMKMFVLASFCPRAVQNGTFRATFRLPGLGGPSDLQVLVPSQSVGSLTTSFVEQQALQSKMKMEPMTEATRPSGLCSGKHWDPSDRRMRAGWAGSAFEDLLS